MLSNLVSNITCLVTKLLKFVSACYTNFHLEGTLVHRMLLPACCQIGRTVCWYPFILLGEERYCKS